MSPIQRRHSKSSTGFECPMCHKVYRWRTDSQRVTTPEGDTLHVTCKCGIDNWKETPREEGKID